MKTCSRVRRSLTTFFFGLDKIHHNCRFTMGHRYREEPLAPGPGPRGPRGRAGAGRGRALGAAPADGAERALEGSGGEGSATEVGTPGSLHCALPRREEGTTPGRRRGNGSRRRDENRWPSGRRFSKVLFDTTGPKGGNAATLSECWKSKRSSRRGR